MFHYGERYRELFLTVYLLIEISVQVYSGVFLAKPKVQSFLFLLLIPLKFFLSFLGPQVEGRRITIEVRSSKDVASVTVDGTKVCRV